MNKEKTIASSDIIQSLENQHNCLVSISNKYKKIDLLINIIKELILTKKNIWYITERLSKFQLSQIEQGVGSDKVSIQSLWKRDSSFNQCVIWSLKILTDNIHKILNSQNNPDLIIINYLELIDQPETGSTIEQLILRLPKNIPIIGFVLPCSNISEISNWFNIIFDRPFDLFEIYQNNKNKNLCFLLSDNSIVPFCSKKKIATKVKKYLKENEPITTKGFYKLLKPLIKQIKTDKDLPALFIMSSEQECDQAFEHCIYQQKEIGNILTTPQIINFFQKYSDLKNNKQIIEILYRKAGSFHLNKPDHWNEILEVFLSLGGIDIIFATVEAAQNLTFQFKTIIHTSSQSLNKTADKKEISNIWNLIPDPDNNCEPGNIILTHADNINLVYLKDIYFLKPDSIKSNLKASIQTVIGLCKTYTLNAKSKVDDSLFTIQNKEQSDDYLNELLTLLQEKIPNACCSSPSSAIALVNLSKQLKLQADQILFNIKKGHSNQKAKKELEFIQSQLAIFPCEKCIHQQDCQELRYKKIRSIIDEYYELTYDSKHQYPIFMLDFERYLSGLIETNFIDENQVLTDKGLITLQTGLASPLAIAECLYKKIIPLEDPIISKAIIAGFVELDKYQAIHPINNFINDTLIDVYNKISTAIKTLNTDLLKSGILISEPVISQSSLILAYESGISPEIIANKANISVRMLIEIIHKQRYLREQIYAMSTF